jgi:hypothetical protein
MSSPNIRLYHKLQLQANVQFMRKRVKEIIKAFNQIIICLLWLYVMPIDTPLYWGQLQLSRFYAIAQNDRREFLDICYVAYRSMSYQFECLNPVQMIFNICIDGYRLKFNSIIYQYRKRLYKIRKRYNRLCIQRQLTDTTRLNRLFRWFAYHQLFPYLVIFNRMTMLSVDLK